jgi:diacylglycerol kinase (ATP)
VGLRATWRTQAAFRQEACLGFVLVPASMLLGRSTIERAALICVWLLVLAVELLNTGLEAVVDRIGPERHELSGLAKDAGSAAVLVSFLVATLLWLAVAWDRFIT